MKPDRYKEFKTKLTELHKAFSKQSKTITNTQGLRYYIEQNKQLYLKHRTDVDKLITEYLAESIYHVFNRH